jgi:hypothetical protein
MGGWSSGSTTTNFDVYRTSFVLSGADIVTAPASGTPRGDAFLLGNSSGACPTGATCNAGTSWLANDKIVGLGVKMRSPQQSGAPGFASFFVNVQPNAQTGFEWSSGTKSSSTPGQNSFDATGGQNGASQGSFAINVITSTNAAQNRGPYGGYTVKTGGNGSDSFNTIPYGGIAANGNCPATAYGGFGQLANCSSLQITATLPVRVFGNGISNNSNNDPAAAWDYYEIFMNESLMQRAGKGEAPFTSNAQWSVTAQSGNNFTTAAGNFNFAPVPGPLPVLGAVAALGWSRKLRRRIKDRSAAAPKTTI